MIHFDLAIVRANVREADQVVGDIYALAACNETGHNRLTAVLTAGTTILVLHGMGVLPDLRLGQSPPAAGPEVVAPTPAAIEPTREPEVEETPPPLAAPEPAPLLVAAAIDTTVPTKAAEVTTTAPSSEPEDNKSGLRLGSIDYFKLNEDLEHVSNALDRFNQKLLAALGQRKTGTTSNADDGDDTVALDELENQP